MVSSYEGKHALFAGKITLLPVKLYPPALAFFPETFHRPIVRHTNKTVSGPGETHDEFLCMSQRTLLTGTISMAARAAPTAIMLSNTA